MPMSIKILVFINFKKCFPPFCFVLCNGLFCRLCQQHLFIYSLRTATFLGTQAQISPSEAVFCQHEKRRAAKTFFAVTSKTVDWSCQSMAGSKLRVVCSIFPFSILQLPSLNMSFKGFLFQKALYEILNESWLDQL